MMKRRLVYYFIGLLGVVVLVIGITILIKNQSDIKEDVPEDAVVTETPDKVENTKNKQFVMPVVDYRIAPTKYETNDVIVMGFDIRDFDVEPNSGVDVTNKVQAALAVLGRDGGGTLFMPEGEYIIEGKLNIPKGVTICGDWRNPIDNPEVKGTILCVYDGKGNSNAEPFITVQPNACVRDITFWYPEQKADEIVEYPPTIRLYDPTVWGADYTHVKNCTFINSYIAIKQGPNVSNSPNVQNIYGTALYQGLNVDGLIDIGRFDYITFSPDFWAKSGLEGAPEIDGPHKDYIYANATGITLGRVDWSYFTNTQVTGYNVGIRFKSSINAETGVEEHNYPNGQVFRHTYTDCQTGILIEGLASVGESFAEIKIDHCVTGIHTLANENAMETHAQFFNSEIIATEYAVKQEGYGKLEMLQCSILSGEVYSNNGIVVYTDCDFNTPDNHITLDTGTGNAIIAGNRFKGTPDIQNIALCKVYYDEELIEVEELKEIPDCRVEAGKPAKAELYVVAADTTGEVDATEIIQELLTKAGKDGGGVVFLPPGNYRIDGNLKVPSGVELKGAVDLGRNPINLGTILQVYSGAGDGDGTATVTMEANSGIRGLVFNYPEQDYLNLKPYPYGVRAEGENVYVINVSFRNGYNGLDFMTNRCDNHYIEYLAGICFNNAIKVGGGSKNGKIINVQMNGNCVTSGDEAKFGTWPNSLEGENREAKNQALHKYVQENLVVFLIGDVTDELLFDNFSYFANEAVKFVKENGNGASGWCVGQGADYSTKSFHFEYLEEMQFVNTQMVSFKQSYVETEELSQILLGDSFAGEAVFYNASFWGGARNNIVVKGGNLKMYNGNLCDVPDPAMRVEGGTADFINLSFQNGSDLQIAQNDVSRIGILSMLYKNTLRSSQGFREFKNAVKIGERFAVPGNSYNLKPTSDILFAENFVGYPVSYQNNVENALGTTDNFSEIQSPSANAFVALEKDDEGSYARLYSDNTVAQSYIYNHSINLQTGLENSIYTIETRLQFREICENSDARLFCCMHNIRDGKETGTVLLFDFNNNYTFVVNGKTLASWKEGEWYRIVIRVDLSDTTNKTYVVGLYDDNNKLLGESEVLRLSDSMQNNNDNFGGLIFGALSGTTSQKLSANDLLIDYVAVFR